MQGRLDNTQTSAQYRLAWLSYSEARYRLLAYLAAGQTQLNLWTASFEGIPHIENHTQDWEQFMILVTVLHNDPEIIIFSQLKTMLYAILKI